MAAATAPGGCQRREPGTEFVFAVRPASLAQAGTMRAHQAPSGRGVVLVTRRWCAEHDPAARCLAWPGRCQDDGAWLILVCIVVDYFAPRISRALIICLIVLGGIVLCRLLGPLEFWAAGTGGG